jgi:hypothetical protein
MFNNKSLVHCDYNEHMSASILDILESSLGELKPDRIDALDAAGIEALAEAVNQFYAGWVLPDLNDELSMYAGGWVAGNLEAVEARQYLYTTLLYYPKIIIHDPIAEWFFPDRSSLQSPPLITDTRGNGVQISEPALLSGDGYYALKADPERTKHKLKQSLSMLTELALLIREGVVISVPQWKIIKDRQDAILTATRHDVGDSDFLST